MKKLASIVLAFTMLGASQAQDPIDPVPVDGQCFICKAVCVDGGILQTCPGFDGPPGGVRCIIA